MSVVIGIDLGTVYSCVAVYRKGRVEVIANEQGSRTTPSCVAFTDTEELVGEAALNQLPLNIDNTVYGVKRLIGRKFQEKSVQDDIKTWPFNVIDRGDTKPMVMVTYQNTQQTYFPEEISSRVLEKLKQDAESYLGERVTDAVITVPAYFSDAQRQATKVAGRIAGLNVPRIINEPTAAALAYGMDNMDKETCNILIYDLGGGTFDVSIVNMEGGVFDVCATSGNSHLGGEDFTNHLTEYFVDKIKTTKGVDISRDTTSRAYLKMACETAKRQLSSSLSAVVHLNSPLVNYTGNISRACFDHLNGDLFNSTIDSVKEALNIANMDKSSIDHVVLIGGSTRIPRVQTIIKEYFGKDKLTHTINPDEAVAMGAAIQGALLHEQETERLKDIVLMDVTPLSLGTNVLNSEMSVILPRNKKIPAKATKRYVTVNDNQSSMSIAIFEGESELVTDNNQLGNFFLNGLSPAPRGDVKVDVTFQIDCDGILHVTANETSCNNSKSETLVINKDRLTDDQINELITNARRNREQDEVHRNITRLKNELEDLCLQTTTAIQNEDKNDSDKKIILDECSDTLRWLRSTAISSVEQMETRRDVLVELLNTYN